MNKHLLLELATSALLATDTFAQKKKEIIPRDSITGKYCYQAISDTVPFSKSW